MRQEGQGCQSTTRRGTCAPWIGKLAEDQHITTTDSSVHEPLRMIKQKSDHPENAKQRWSWIFDQFYAAQRSDFGFMSRSKPQSWFLSSIGFGWGQQAMG